MITPVDLETVVFRRGLRGYSTKEVQEFMTRITHDYEHIYCENIDLKEKMEELNSKLAQYKTIEETLRNTMILAQETAKEVKISAQQQAELILREAQQQGDQIKAKVKEEIQENLQTLASLKNRVEFFKCQFKSFLVGLTDIVDKQLDLQLVWDYIQKQPAPAKENPLQTGESFPDGPVSVEV
jgi:cell division initiation protein